jgi:hypothetical protein
MPKERVIVFEGEDKFIVNRDSNFNKLTGEKQFVGGKNSNPSENENIPTNPDKEAFDRYVSRRAAPIIMPSPVEPNFCERIKEFIENRGNGLATSEQVMQAYELFQNNCIEKPIDNPPIVGEPEQPPVEKVIVEKPKDVEVPPASTPLPKSFVPLNTPSLGKPPSSSGGGGGGDEAQTQPKKQINWLLLAIIGGGILYLVTRKKD